MDPKKKRCFPGEQQSSSSSSSSSIFILTRCLQFLMLGGDALCERWSNASIKRLKELIFAHARQVCAETLAGLREPQGAQAIIYVHK